MAIFNKRAVLLTLLSECIQKLHMSGLHSRIVCERPTAWHGWLCELLFSGQMFLLCSQCFLRPAQVALAWALSLVPVCGTNSIVRVSVNAQEGFLLPLWGALNYWEENLWKAQWKMQGSKPPLPSPGSSGCYIPG